MTVWHSLLRVSVAALILAALLILSATRLPAGVSVGALLVVMLVGAAAWRHARRTRNFRAWVRSERAALRGLRDHPERWVGMAAADAERLLNDLDLSTQRGEWRVEDAHATYAAYRRRRLPAVPAPAAPPF